MATRHIIIAAIIVLILSTAASAQWLRQGHDDDRTHHYDDLDTTFNITNSSTVAITCGTGSAQKMSPGVFGTFGDTDSYPDLFLMCAPDSDNANVHIRMISDSLAQLDTATLVSDGQLRNDFLPFSVCEYDGDVDTIEFCILNIEDTNPVGGFDYFSILVYSFDPAGAQQFTKINEWFLNDTPSGAGVIVQTDGGEYNITGTMSNDPNEQFIECYFGNDPTCYIVADPYVFATNMTLNNTVKWIDDTGGDLQMYYVLAEHPPLFVGDYMYVMNYTNDYVYRINVTSGYLDTIRLNSGTVTYETWSAYDCDTGDCSVQHDEIVASDRTENKAYIFDISDGTLLETVSLPSVGTFTYTWIEDRDADGSYELCVAFFDGVESGSEDSAAKCEELNFFAFDTLDDEFGFNTTSDASVSDVVVRTDLNGDNKDDLIVGTNILMSSGTHFIPYVIQSLYDTASPTDDLGSIYSAFDHTASLAGSILSWHTELSGNDTVFLTSSFALESELANLPEFYLDPVQSIANPICNYSTVEFTCTYANGCAIDEEYDRFGICYDCFSDGSQAACLSSAEFFLVYDSWECDVSGKSGIQNMTVDIFEDGYEDNNDSITYQYVVDSAGCYNETNPGNVTEPEINIPPTFTGIPVSLYPEPYCRDSTIRFVCDTPGCYYDPEDDDVWFAVDCNDDGVYEKTTSVGVNNFSCAFNYSVNDSGSHQVNVRVRDLAHQGEFYDEVGFSVTISNYSRSDVEAAGELLCSSAGFFAADGTIDIPDAPDEESSAANAVYRAYAAFGALFGLSVSLVAWLVTLLAACMVVYGGYQVNSSMAITGGAIFFCGFAVFHALAGCTGWTGVIVMVVMAVGFGVYRAAGNQGG